MKPLGLILTIVGVLLVLGGLRGILAVHDLSDSHELSKAAAGFGVAIVVLVGGLALIRNSKGK